jgi:hypothetical protein
MKGAFTPKRWNGVVPEINFETGSPSRDGKEDDNWVENV